MSLDKYLTVEQIQKLLPHRYPMLLVDRMVKLDPGKSAEGIKNVTLNEWFFAGHFPGRPIMPGVLIIEALAQAAGVLVVHTLTQGNEADKQHKGTVYFMSIDKVRFRKPVVPGDTLRLCVEVLQSRGVVWKFLGKAYVGETLVSEGEFKAMIAEEKEDI